MKIAISIGTYRMTAYVELNLASCRKIFGNCPIVLSDGKHEDSAKMEELAAKYGAYYYGTHGEDRGHFAGCVQNAVCALSFAKDQGCDIALKINQRFILVNPSILDMVKHIFRDPHVDIVLPGRPQHHLLIRSKFFAQFPFLVDCIFMRAAGVNEKYIKEQYELQWRTRPDKVGTYSEVLWMRLLAGQYRMRHAVLHCLTDHHLGWPQFFLRKCQNTNGDFLAHAQSLGLNHLQLSDFPVEEWGEIKKNQYWPFPKA